MKAPQWVKRLQRKGFTVTPKAVASIQPTVTWYGKVANWLDQRDRQIRDSEKRTTGGKRLLFELHGHALGRPRYRVSSVRGGFTMGQIEWSNQWREPKFVPAYEAVFDRQSIAEIYAKLRDFEK